MAPLSTTMKLGLIGSLTRAVRLQANAKSTALNKTRWVSQDGKLASELDMLPDGTLRSLKLDQTGVAGDTEPQTVKGTSGIQIRNHRMWNEATKKAETVNKAYYTQDIPVNGVYHRVYIPSKKGRERGCEFKVEKYVEEKWVEVPGTSKIYPGYSIGRKDDWVFVNHDSKNVKIDSNDTVYGLYHATAGVEAVLEHTDDGDEDLDISAIVFAPEDGDKRFVRMSDLVSKSETLNSENKSIILKDSVAVVSRDDTGMILVQPMVNGETVDNTYIRFNSIQDLKQFSNTNPNLGTGDHLGARINLEHYPEIQKKNDDASVFAQLLDPASYKEVAMENMEALESTMETNVCWEFNVGFIAGVFALLLLGVLVAILFSQIKRKYNKGQESN